MDGGGLGGRDPTAHQCRKMNFFFISTLLPWKSPASSVAAMWFGGDGVRMNMAAPTTSQRNFSLLKFLGGERGTQWLLDHHDITLL